MKPSVIYVAGPFSHPTTDGIMKNVRRAMAVGARLRDAGLTVIVPHLSLYFDKYHPAPYETWMRMDFALLERCDALLRIASSPGTDREVAHAAAKGIPVYLDVEALLREAAA